MTKRAAIGMTSKPMETTDHDRMSVRQQRGAGRALVLDRGLPLISVINETLDALDFDIITVNDIGAAIDVAEDTELSMAFVDVCAGEIDGVSAFSRLRRIKNEQSLPIIAIGDGDCDRAAITIENGASDVLLSPTNATLVRSRIESIAELRSVRNKLHEAEERYFLAAQGANDGIWEWQLDTDKAYYSPRWNDILGLDGEQLGVTPACLLGRIHPEDRNAFQKQFDQHIAGNTNHFETEARIRHNDGSYLWMLCRGKADHDGSGKAVRISGSMSDITAGKVADPVTGLPNRVLFQHRVDRCLDQYRANSRHAFAVMFVDLDNFKVVNDTLGHDAGDRLLMSVARRLEGSVRSSESVVARLGGDEFALLIENIESQEDAELVARRVLSNFESPFPLGEAREVFTSLSLGLTIVSERCQTSEELLREADAAMYFAKSQGKSCFRSFEPSMRENVSSRLRLETELRRAIENEEFLLNFQPLVNLDTCGLVGFEALVRWRHPELGVVSPAEFMSVAEETGLIGPISAWVLRKACLQQVEWKRKFSITDPLKISVNVSRRQVVHSDLPKDVEAILQETGICPSELKLEISEATIMEDDETGTRLLADLQSLGVEVAIDDFGTGLSSLASLHRLPLNSLKIDQSFVGSMITSRESRMIVETIVTLAQSIGIDVIAEGIETDRQCKLLRTMGCSLGQGFLFSPPLTTVDATRMIAHQEPSAACVLSNDGVPIMQGILQ